MALSCIRWPRKVPGLCLGSWLGQAICSTRRRCQAGTQPLDWFVALPEGAGRRGISQGDLQRSTLRIVDADDGGLREDAVPGTSSGAVSWVPAVMPWSATAISTRRLGRHRRSGGTTAGPARHRLGTPAADDIGLPPAASVPGCAMAPVDRPLVFTPPGIGTG